MNKPETTPVAAPPATERRYAVVLSDRLTGGVAVNTAVHLAAQFGGRCPAVAGPPVSDATGTEHAGLPVVPNVILAAAPEDLRARLGRARSLAAAAREFVVLDYPEQGHTTSTDEAYRTAVAGAAEECLTYFGFLVYGPRRAVSEVTKGLRLWAGGPTPIPARSPNA